MNPTDPVVSIYEIAEQKHASIRRVMDFTSLANPVGPSEKAKHAMRRAVKDVSLPPDPQTRYLRRLIAKREDVSPDSIVFGHGSTHLIGILMKVLGIKNVLVPTPVPSRYGHLIERQNARLMVFSLSNPSDMPIEIDRLAGLATQADMLLLPNPHTITGDVVPAATLGELAHRFESEGRYIVIDEELIEFTQGMSVIDLTRTYSNLTVLRSFSSFHSLGGLPLGYLCAASPIVRLVIEALDTGPVSNLVAAAALASLRDTGFRKRTAEFIKTEKEYLKKKLGQMTGLDIIDTPCNFLLLRFREPVTDLPERLRQTGVVIKLLTDESGRDLLRLPIRVRRENARFAKTLLRIIGKKGGSAETDTGETSN